MSDDLTLEVAQQLTEGNTTDAEESRHLELTEIFEALLLAVVAVLTAWSGYEAAQWDGKNALYYEQSSREHTLATRQSNLAGQQLLYDTTTFNSWDAASTAGHTQLANRYVKRFTPDYRVAFDAWLKLDPETNPHAPAVPSAMPQYRNPATTAARRLDELSDSTFDKGTEARHTSHEYLRSTVLLATVLFLTAIAQRFKVKRVRHGLIAVAFVILLYTGLTVATYPRL